MGLKVLSSVVISALFLSTSVITESLAKEYKVKQTRVLKKAKKSKKERKKKALVHIVDSFSDGSYLQQPEWWRFGSLYLSVENNKMKKKFLGKKSMRLQGITDKWYVGGCGSYLSADLENFKVIKLVIYSPNANSALLKIELYDDDNKNNTVDMDSITGKMTADDVFVYNLMVDWEGWKVVSIPLSDFRDANIKVGDNVWNPYKTQNSGGLLQLQLLAFTSKEAKGEVDLKIDTIKFN